MSEYPEIGLLTVWDRLRGWKDIRCSHCRTICGNTRQHAFLALLRPARATATCGQCTKLALATADWLRSIRGPLYDRDAAREKAS